MQHLIDFHQDTERNIIIGNDFIFKFEKANEVQDVLKTKNTISNSSRESAQQKSFINLISN